MELLGSLSTGAICYWLMFLVESRCLLPCNPSTVFHPTAMVMTLSPAVFNFKLFVNTIIYLQILE